MMKKITATVLALALGLAPVVVSAAPTLTGVNLAPVFFAIGVAPQFSFNSYSYPNTPFMYETNPIIPFAGSFDVYPILGFSIVCVPYNTSVLGNTNYPYVAEDNGISGGIVTVVETKSDNTTVTIDTFVMPDSPHNGPYVNYTSSLLGSPYIATAGSTISAYISSVSGSSDQGWASCVVSTTLG
jgi:hypothetical protein